MKLKMIPALLALLTLLGGCGGSADYRPLKAIQSSRLLNVAVVLAGEPYAYMAGGKFQGDEIELMTGFARHMGLEAVFTAIAPADVPSTLQSKTADVAVGRLTSVSAGGLTSSLSSPTGSEKAYALSLRGAPYTSCAAMTQRKVGYLGASVNDIMSAYSGVFAEYVAVNNIESAAHLLKNKSVDVVCCFAADADKILTAYGDEIECNDISDVATLNYGAAVTKRNVELLREINLYIDSLKDDAGEA